MLDPRDADLLEAVAHLAVQGLVEAYVFAGQEEKAVERGFFWLRQARAAGVEEGPLRGARLMLAQVMEGRWRIILPLMTL